MDEILTSLHEREDIQIESSYSDRKESTLVNTFLADGCRCKLNCHVSIGREAIERHRGNCAELSKLELDMAILGQLAALDHHGPTGGVHRRDVVRAHTRCEFYFEGEKKQKCLFLYGIVYQSMVLELLFSPRPWRHH